MKASIVLVLCCALGSTFGYYVQREGPYNNGPNDPYAVEVNSNFLPEPSQRLFWGNGAAGSNQVGGAGWWSSLTNKFPILGTMFGRMEQPSNQYGPPSTYYGPPPFYQRPQTYSYYPQQYYRPQFQSGRDFGFTDDAVIITPPQVPISQPVRPPAAPVDQGYQYNKPQYRLELPQK